MSDEAPRDLDWPTRRWLMWGVIAVLALIAIVLFFVWIGNKTSDGDTTGDTAAAEQVEWKITLTDMGGQEVTLKADKPAGLTSETWVDGAQLERGTTTRWAWDMGAALPKPVVDIDDAADCAALEAQLTEWVAGIASAQGEVFNWQSRAFAQHTVNRMRDQSCEIDEAAINSALGG